MTWRALEGTLQGVLVALGSLLSLGLFLYKLTFFVNYFIKIINFNYFLKFLRFFFKISKNN